MAKNKKADAASAFDVEYALETRIREIENLSDPAAQLLNIKPSGNLLKGSMMKPKLFTVR